VEFTKQGHVQLKQEDVSIEDLEPTEVVIRNEASIISAGTELAALRNEEYNGIAYPYRPGYGSIGKIIAKGDAVLDREIGQRVFYAGKHAEIQRFKHTHAQQWEYLFPVPEQLSSVEASVGCLAQIAITAPHLSELYLGDTVAIFGLGTIGLLTALLYRHYGARVIGIDPVHNRCEAAKKLGIHEVIHAPAHEQLQQLMSLTEGKGAEITVDAVGHSGVIQQAIKATSLFGQVILLGSPRTPLQGNLTDAFAAVHMNGLRLIGAHMHQFPLKPERGVTHSVERNFDTIFTLIANQKLEVLPLISHIINPEEAPSAYHGLANMRDTYTCVVMNWAD
jgi:2-desacetyl-2-hydroxyethyl bacteriochlorophyllide A dehydrogenase